MIDETTFTFHKSKYFWKFVNKQFDLSDLTKAYGTDEGNFELVLCSNIPSSPYDCIDELTGCLDEGNDDLVMIPIQDESSDEMPYFNLKCTWINEGDGGFVLSLDNGSSDIQVKIGDRTEYLRAIYLVHRSNRFVMAYATIPSPIPIKNFVSLPFDAKLFGVGYCSSQIQ